MGRRLGGRCEGGERRKRAVRGAVTTPTRLARHVAGPECGAGKERRPSCAKVGATEARRGASGLGGVALCGQREWRPQGVETGAAERNVPAQPRRATGRFGSSPRWPPASPPPWGRERVWAEVKCPVVPRPAGAAPGGRRGGRGGGGVRPGSAAATLGQELSAITVAAVPSGAPSWRPLPPGPLPALGAPGVRPAAGGPALPAAWSRMLRGAGARPDCFDVGGREELSPGDWGPGGAGGGEVPGEPGRPAGWRTFPPPRVIVPALRVRIRGERRAVRGRGWRKREGFASLMGKISHLWARQS